MDSKIKFQDNYRLKIATDSNGNQSIVLAKYYGEDEIMSFTLDLSDIRKQCEPFNLIAQAIRDLKTDIQVAEYSLDNYRYKSGEMDIEHYRTNINNAIENARRVIDVITHDKIFADNISTDTPF